MKKIISISLVAIPVSGAFYWKRILDDVYGRFPHLNRKELRKSTRHFMIDSFLGRLPDIQEYTDEEMDTLFLDRHFTIK